MARGKRKTAAQLEREVELYLAESRTSSRGLKYRAIGSDGDPWPTWLHAFGRSCGTYVIRDKQSEQPLYVGSSKSRLYDTITRHFQQWKRDKKWWKGLYGAGHDPGLTYKRSDVELAVKPITCEELLEAEAKLIAALHPRDNLVEHPEGELEEAPF